MRPVKKRDVELAIAYTPRGRAKRQVIRIDLFAGGKKLNFKLADQGLADEFVAQFPGCQTRAGKGFLRCRLLTDSKTEAERTAKILDWILARLWPIAGPDTTS